MAERGDGVGAFVQVSARGLLLGTGIPMPAPDQLQRLRASIADPSSGKSFGEAVEEVRAAGGRVFGGRWDPLRRAPRGYPADHPRAEFLRWKGVEIGHRPGLPVWLGQYVGASARSAAERFAPKRRAAAES